MPLLSEVGRILVAVLGVYGVLRLYDLGVRGVLPLAFESSYEGVFFQIEFLLGLIAPMVMLALPRVRASGRGLYAASLLVALGFIVNRLNVSITGMEAASGVHYIPAWSEVFITLMIVALGFGAFSLGVRYLNVYPETTDDEAEEIGGAEPIVVAGTR
jgi:Ni/Fe-hydrogenase subunit HybB-like protein